MNSPIVRQVITLATAVLLLASCGSGAAWTYPPPAASPLPAASGEAPSNSPGASSAAPSSSPGASAAPSPSGVAGPTGAPVAGAPLQIEAFDLGFTPKDLTVDAAGTYTVEFKNTGAIAHDITPDGGETHTAQAGETVTFEVEVPEGGLPFVCSVPGHAAAGMTGTIAVAGSTAGSGDSHGGPAPDTGAVEADPNAPAYTLDDPTAPKVMDGAVHEITLTIEEKEMTVAEGFVQKVWTFNGSVPGPVVRVHQGDTIRVHLVNPAASEVDHSIDFHASQVAWNDEMRSIKPGDELIYEWKADYAGVWMYHCGTAPALHHIANGMFGMVIVEPEGGFKPADHEFAIVQSEWYLGPQGEITDLAKAAAGAPAPDFVVFNGVANQYVDNPIKVETGKTVRVFVLDAGPSIDSSFHVVGTIFNTVIKEGIQLTPENDGHYGSQAVDLSPAQGAIIEFTTPEDGLYPMVTHAFNFVGRGALGLFQAGDGDPTN
ncbi:MAG: multicopper oxidase domain-containing protein [Candidatus Limnocylindrales bacterium]